MEKSIRIAQILGDKQEYYLGHSCKTIDKSLLYTPGPDVIEKVWMNSDRNLPTLNNMRRLLMQGRLANTGYVSILPVDQGVEHTAGASFAPGRRGPRRGGGPSAARRPPPGHPPPRGSSPRRRAGRRRPGERR